jgi:hypothetical protein
LVLLIYFFCSAYLMHFFSIYPSTYAVFSCTISDAQCLHSKPPHSHSTTSTFITATAHSPVLPHIESSTEAAFILLITKSQTQEFTVRYPPRTTSQGIIPHQFFITLLAYFSSS